MAKIRVKNNSIFAVKPQQSYGYVGITESEMRQWNAGNDAKDKNVILKKKAQQAIKVLEENIKNGVGVEAPAGRYTRYDNPPNIPTAAPDAVLDFDIPKGL